MPLLMVCFLLLAKGNYIPLCLLSFFFPFLEDRKFGVKPVLPGIIILQTSSPFGLFSFLALAF